MATARSKDGDDGISPKESPKAHHPQDADTTSGMLTAEAPPAAEASFNNVRSAALVPTAKRSNDYSTERPDQPQGMHALCLVGRSTHYSVVELSHSVGQPIVEKEQQQHQEQQQQVTSDESSLVDAINEREKDALALERLHARCILSTKIDRDDLCEDHERNNSEGQVTILGVKRHGDHLAASGRPQQKYAVLEQTSLSAGEVTRIGQDAVEEQTASGALLTLVPGPNTVVRPGGENSEADYVLIRKESDDFASNPMLHEISMITWVECTTGNHLIGPNDVGSAPDVVTLAMAQCDPCALVEDERNGRYKHQEPNYIGLTCRHCFGQPGNGKYFPSTKPSFVASFPQTIVGHVKTCVGTPPAWKLLIKELEDRQQKSEPRHRNFVGTKGLLEHIWDKLHMYKAETIPQRNEEELSRKVLHSKIPGTNISCGDLIEQHQPKDSECLVTIKDYSLVPDALFAAFSQVTVCFASDDDCRSVGRHQPKIDPGFKGICCLHCQGESGAFRFFPTSAESLSQIDTCSKVSSHMLRKCQHVPASIREAMEIMKAKEKEEPQRYGIRKVFFRRLWAKLHE